MKKLTKIAENLRRPFTKDILKRLNNEHLSNHIPATYTKSPREEQQSCLRITIPTI